MSTIRELADAPLRGFKPHTAYQESGIRWLKAIPRHWRQKRLRFVVRLNPPKSEIREFDPERSVSFVPMEAVEEYGGLQLEFTKPLGSVLEGYTYFRDGDVLVAKITPCFENGKGALAAGLEGGVGFGTTELHVLRPGDTLDVRFLFYLSLSDHFRRLGAAAMYGAGGQKRVPEDYIRDLRHPLPDLDEQRAIAAFLDRETAKIDALLVKKERLIKLLREQRAALITRAATKGLDPNVPMKGSGVEWLGDIPAHWRGFQLRRVVRKFVDYRGATPRKTPSGVRLVTAGNIKDGQIDFSLSEEFISEEEYKTWMSRGLPARGDVLLTTEAPLGEVAQVSDADVALAQRIILLKAAPETVESAFLKYVFLSRYGRAALESRATGSTALGIKASHLKATWLVLPPIEEQRAIVAFLDWQTQGIDALVAKVRDAVGRLKEYRIALISAAVTGKIDVREEVV